MKTKGLGVILLIIVILSTVAMSTRAASTINVSIDEKIYSRETDAILETTWTGQPDNHGYIYLPKPVGIALWKNTTVLGVNADR